MNRAYHILLHLLGLGCIAACLGIVISRGDLNIHWSGWVAVGYFVFLAIGILCGWFPWRGKPLRVLVKGVYTMSALALIGFGFKIDDPLRPELWMVLAGLVAAIVVRVILKVIFHLRDDRGDSEGEPGSGRTPVSAGDSLFD